MYVDHRAQQLHWDPPQVAVLAPPPPPLLLTIPTSVTPPIPPNDIIQHGAKGRYKETNATIKVRARAGPALLPACRLLPPPLPPAALTPPPPPLIVQFMTVRDGDKMAAGYGCCMICCVPVALCFLCGVDVIHVTFEKRRTPSGSAAALMMSVRSRSLAVFGKLGRGTDTYASPVARVERYVHVRNEEKDDDDDPTDCAAILTVTLQDGTEIPIACSEHGDPDKKMASMVLARVNAFLDEVRGARGAPPAYSSIPIAPAATTQGLTATPSFPHS